MAGRIKCPAVNCNITFTRQYNLNRHFENYHNNNDIVEKCVLCGQIFNDITLLNTHYRKFHKPTKKFYEKESAFRRNVITFRYNFSENEMNFSHSQAKIKNYIKETIVNQAANKTIIKSSLIYICEMSMIDHAGEKIVSTLIPFRAPAFTSNAVDTRAINMNIRHSFAFQNNSMEEFCNSGSNWVFNRAVAFDVEITALRPVLIGTNPNTYGFKKRYKKSENVDVLNLKELRNTKYIFNPNNKDQKCFLYCLHHFLTTVKNYKKNFKQFEKSLNLKNISFPITIPHIKKFMNQNKNLNIKINILLRHTNKEIYPYEYGIGDGKCFMNLLLLYRQMGAKCHFLLILDLNKFLRKVYPNNSYEKKIYCENCLNHFYSVKFAEEHKKLCCLNKPRTELTPKNPKIEFKNRKNQIPLEYIAFLDFECILPKQGVVCEECTHLRCKCDRSYTHITTNQEPITYSFIILDMQSKVIHKKTYSGVDAADHFVDHLLKEEEDWIKPLFTTFKELKLTTRQQITFENTTKCYLCKKDFDEENKHLIKCRDHCHYTGKFLGAACSKCNLERQYSRKLRIFMHNGSRFDFHFIIKALKNKNNLKNVHVLPYNMEHFRTINFNSFIFIDSMSFLQSSLAKLSDDLAKTNNPYSILRQTNLCQTDGIFSLKKFNLVLGKSYFPYEFW